MTFDEIEENNSQLSICFGSVLQALAGSLMLDPESLLSFSHVCRTIRATIMAENGSSWKQLYLVVFGTKLSANMCCSDAAEACIRRFCCFDENARLERSKRRLDSLFLELSKSKNVDNVQQYLDGIKSETLSMHEAAECLARKLELQTHCLALVEDETRPLKVPFRQYFAQETHGGKSVHFRNWSSGERDSACDIEIFPSNGSQQLTILFSMSHDGPTDTTTVSLFYRKGDNVDLHCIILLEYLGAQGQSIVWNGSIAALQEVCTALLGESVVYTLFHDYEDGLLIELVDLLFGIDEATLAVQSTPQPLQ